MITQPGSRWLGNSAVNIAGGLSVALFNLALPMLLAPQLSTTEFAVWSLALQAAAYVYMFGLGLQTATARFVAQAQVRDDADDLRRTADAASLIMGAVAALALAFVVALAWLYPALFPQVPAQLLPTFRLCLLAIGGASAVQLLALVPMGLFQGTHRNLYFVGPQVVVRLVTLATMLLAAQLQAPLVIHAFVFSLIGVFLVPAMYLLARGHFSWLQLRPGRTIDQVRLKELLAYCGTLSVWSVSMLLVNTVGTIIVGRIAIDSAGPYAVAVTISTVIAGLLQAVLSPLLTTGAALHATREGMLKLPGLLERTTIWSTIGLQTVLVLLMVGYQGFAPRLTPALRTPDFQTALFVLLVSHCLRNTAAPYAMLLVATGLHRRALYTALAEGLSNLVASIVLGSMYGIAGVALGTLVGGVLGLVGNVLFNAPRTPDLIPRPGRYALRGFILPTLGFVPLYALLRALH